MTTPKAPRAPAVKRNRWPGASNARMGARPTPVPHLKPGAVFGPVSTLDPVEAQKRSDAQAAWGKRLLDAFSAPANDDAVLLTERRFGQCSWPVGDPDRPANQLCCAAPVQCGGVKGVGVKGVETYCAKHALRAVQRTTLGGKPDVKAYERSLRRYA